MAKDWDLIITGGAVYTPSGLVEADVAVADGRIADIGKLDAARADEVLDAKGLTVLPGVIDTQVHFREPGLEHKEDLESGTRAAVMGGVTAIFEMPNTSPPTTDAAAINDKLTRAEGRAWCDHAFFAGAAAENAEKLGELERLPGVCGVKIFMGSSTGSLLVHEDNDLRRILKHVRRRVAVHSEDEVRLRERFDMIREGGKVSQHPEWRDVETALRSTKRLLRLAREAGKRIHVLHVTTAEEVPLLAAAKDIATMEVTPQHVTLAAPYCYEEIGSFAQMNPPIREARHREALWEAVRLGIVDVVGSDHAPHTREEKQAPYPRSPSGMPGVQTLLPLLLDHLNAGKLTLERLVDLTSAGAQRIYNIAGKGRIAVGYDADLTIVDMKRRETITNDWVRSRAGWSPYDGVTVTGWPVGTIVRGNTVMWQGELVTPSKGQPMRFLEALPQG